MPTVDEKLDEKKASVYVEIDEKLSRCKDIEKELDEKTAVMYEELDQKLSGLGVPQADRPTLVKSGLIRSASKAAAGSAARASEKVITVGSKVINAQPILTYLGHVGKYWNLSMGRLNKSSSRVKIFALEDEKRVVPETPSVLEAFSSESASDSKVSDSVSNALAISGSVSEWAARVVARASKESMDKMLADCAQTVTVPIIKLGVPWRGAYQRTLVVGEGKVVTLDPKTQRQTNVWWLNRGDVTKAVTNKASGTITLSIAPFSDAPEWLHQKFQFYEEAESVEDAVDKRDATIRVLTSYGVAVEAC